MASFINLDSRDNWKITRVSQEQNQLVNELTHSYRFISDFARKHSVQPVADANELSILGRKLYAAYERKTGKIDRVGQAAMPGTLEEKIEIRECGQTADQRYWQVGIATGGNEYEVVNKAKTALEVLAWCFINGVIDLTTHIQLEQDSSELTTYELHDILMMLHQLMPQPLPKPPQQNFLHVASPLQYVVVVNMGIHPMADLRKKGVQRLSDRNNALDYSGVSRNLVVSIDQLTLNSWNEVTCQAYEGPLALLDFLRDHLQSWSTRTGPAARLDIRCFSAGYATTIQMRMDQLFEDLFACYSVWETDRQKRYILKIGQQYCCFQYTDDHFRYRIFDNHNALLAGLEQHQTSYSPVIFDRYSMGDSELAAVYKSCRKGFIQFFFRVNEETAQIYVVDENGALIQYQTGFYNQENLLVPFQRFVESIMARLDSASPHANLPENRVRYYEIVPQGGKRPPTIESRSAPQSGGANSYLHIRAMVETGTVVAPHYSLYCDNKEFSSIEYGSKLYSRIVEHVLSLRKNGERYPCYITDLDLSTQIATDRLSCFHFLYYKKNLEGSLNKLLSG
ncbi:MAG: class I adenylate cyclase [Pseudomonadales bacterium]|nr:class I adenylate cyclase [Pseudomonadales bacterium]